MRQNAIVKKIINHNIAQIEVIRQSACGHDCDKCGASCGGYEKQVIVANALNKIGAQPGDRVLVEGDNKQILGASAIVYLVPLILFFVFYALGAVSPVAAYAAIIGVIGFFVGIAFAILYSKMLGKRNQITFVIVNFD